MSLSAARYPRSACVICPTFSSSVMRPRRSSTLGAATPGSGVGVPLGPPPGVVVDDPPQATRRRRRKDRAALRMAKILLPFAHATVLDHEHATAVAQQLRAMRGDHDRALADESADDVR